MIFGLFGSKTFSPRLERLRSLSLFINLTPRELKIVDSLLHERQFLKDEVIFDEGEEGQAIYIVIEGSVLICRQINSADTRIPRVRRRGDSIDGRIAELGPGTFFGDLALLGNTPRGAQARAATNCKLAVFFRADFMTLLETQALLASKISLQLARHIGLRLREANLGAHSGQHL
ncbi:MAG: cyclic nucleotide-binding domain-containing protein [Sterolibacterium sp.]|nr:cyclic nucleotide-binding domain-containing protein [Sterolibacterium sp.]